MLLVLFCTDNITAQLAIAIPKFKNRNERNRIEINTGIEKPALFENGEVSANPYFNDVHKYADIKLVRGRAFLNVRTRIDIYMQQASFMLSNGFEMKIEPGQVKEITYSDTTSNGIIFYKFQTGFPNIDRQNTYNFYQILAEGRCSLLKSIIKKLKEKVVIVYSEIDKEYDLFEDYYLFAKGGMKRLKRDKDFFLTELADKREEVSKFILENKINLKNDEQLINVLNYYNSLL